MPPGASGMYACSPRWIVEPDKTVRCFAPAHNAPQEGGCGITGPEVEDMHPDQQAQAKREEDRLRELDEELRFLRWQIAQLEPMLRTALAQVQIVKLATP